MPAAGVMLTALGTRRSKREVTHVPCRGRARDTSWLAPLSFTLPSLLLLLFPPAGPLPSHPAPAFGPRGRQAAAEVRQQQRGRQAASRPCFRHTSPSPPCVFRRKAFAPVGVCSSVSLAQVRCPRRFVPVTVVSVEVQVKSESHNNKVAAEPQPRDGVARRTGVE